MIKRIVTLIALIITAGILMIFSCAGMKVYKVGILNTLDDSMGPIYEGFLEGMAELGYEEGKQITYDMQTESDKSKITSILQKFVADKMNLVLVYPGVDEIREAQNITKDTKISVVFSYADIDGLDIVKSIDAPGGNTTGVRYPASEIALKRLEVLTEILPDAKKIAVPYLKDYQPAQLQLEAIKAQASSSGISIIEIPASDTEELSTQLQNNIKGIDAVLFLIEPLTMAPDNFLAIAKIANKSKIPFGGTYMKVEEYASLFGYTVDPFMAGKEAAVITDQILKGGKPGTIPVVSSETFFQVNILVARELGITIPPDLLNKADRVEN